MYVHYIHLVYMHTVASSTISNQYKATITTTIEASMSVCTYLGAIVCPNTALINI